MPTFTKTTLSTDPPSFEMGDHDRQSFTFSLPSQDANDEIAELISRLAILIDSTVEDIATALSIDLEGIPTTLDSVDITFARTDPEPYTVIEGVASQVGIVGATATVLVEMDGKAVRDDTYELEVALAGSNGNTTTKTLAIPCEA